MESDYSNQRRKGAETSPPGHLRKSSETSDAVTDAICVPAVWIDKVVAYIKECGISS
jgi:hypothetical protein